MTDQGNQRQRRLDRAFLTYSSLFGVALGILAFALGSYCSGTIPLLGGLSNGIGSTLVVASTVGLVFTKISRDLYYEDVRYLVEREKTGFRRLFKNVQDEAFTGQIKALLRNAKEVRMYGMGLSFLKDTEVFDLLSEMASAHRTHVLIFLANTATEPIAMRLREEAQCDRSFGEGEEYIKGVYAALKKIEASIGNPAVFEIRLFDHYPTFAVLDIDGNMFSYPYGYRTSGVSAPVIHLRGDSRQAQYYRNQFDLLSRNYPRKPLAPQS